MLYKISVLLKINIFCVYQDLLITTLNFQILAFVNFTE
jgi:hypothetical protein